MAARAKSGARFVVVSFLLVIFYVVLRPSCFVLGDVRLIPSGGSSRSLLGANRNDNQVLDCRDLASRSQCLQRQKCRWCRSDAIDDMCFGSSEAWRLPQQEFGDVFPIDVPNELPPMEHLPKISLLKVL